MRLSEADILFIPGLGGSGPDHWQARWAEKMSTGSTVPLPGLDKPQFGAWVQAIHEAISGCSRPVLLVGHSLGSIAVVHAVQAMSASRTHDEQTRKVSGAFLVTPPSARILGTLDQIDPNFATIPSAPLPFPSLLVASQNDQYASMAEAQDMALDWGSQVVDAGEAGHINAESGHGPWPEGLMRLAGFLKQI